MDFLVFGEGRTGSNMLVSYLNQQKNIRCHGELFNQCKNDIRLNKCFVNVDYRTKITEQIYTSPSTLINQLDQLSEDKKHGFKLHYYQANDLNTIYNFSIEKYIKDNNIKVIWLDRQNIFLKNLSMQKAQASQCFIITKSMAKNDSDIFRRSNVKIKFDLEKYWLNKQIATHSKNKYRDFFKKNNIEYYEVNYEDLIGENKTTYYRDIVKLIEGTDESFIELEDVDTLKQNTLPINEQLRNFNELKLLLKDDPWFQKSIT